MKITFLHLLVSLICISVPVSESANILFLSPLGSRSHKIFFMGIVNVLAERGHNVTIVSAYKNSKEVKNINDVVLSSSAVTELLTNVFDDGSDKLMQNLFMESPRLCSDGLASKEIQDLKNDKYDIVLLSMFFDTCYLSLVHHYQVPFIYLSPAGLFGPLADMIGAVDFPSISANKLTAAKFPLTFMQRLQTTVLNTVLHVAGEYYLTHKTEKICRERGLCPPDMPSLTDFNAKASLAIINSIRGLDYPPLPSMPNVIYAGGAHIRPGKPLMQELESWVQGAGEAGFIFFSLGSAINPSNLPERHRKSLMNVFSTLPQRVLWKWEEETMPGQPPNVKLGKWLPQQDILGHNKLKLFITHGGLLSTLESTYHGVPILGMPVFADQYSNMAEAAEEGWGRVLTWKELNEESLKLIINEILSNSSLREISVKRSAIMKDVPIHPAEEAAFWVEYVLRHNGARHLRSPFFQISWYEIYNIDVWTLIIISVLIFIFVEALIFKAILRRCFGATEGKAKDKIRKKKQQ